MKPFFYRPKNAWVGDVIPYYEDGEFKLFYLHGWRGNAREGLPHGWHLIGTNDFREYREYGAIDIHGGTGHVLKVGDIYHLFYCIFPEGKQLVCHATGADLMNWTPIPEDTFSADDQIYELSDWRDPFVFWNQEEGQYWMLLAAMAKGPSSRKGCVALLTSQDLRKWAYRQPLYAPNLHVGAHECPDMFRLGDWWYLIYSNYTDRFGTFYRMSRSLDGPWITPKVDTFDGRAFYAAKSVSDGQNRYLFGWNPTKNENLFGWNPPKYAGKDYHTWDWGGNLIVHEIFQRPDGTLAVKVPDAVNQAFTVEQPLHLHAITGEWTNTVSDEYECDSPYAFAASLSAEELPDRCKLSADIRFSEHTQGIGVMLRAGIGLDAAYYVTLEPQRKRMTFRGPIMQSEEGGKTFPYEVELERPIELQPEHEYKVIIFIDGSICEVYFNGEVAMSARMYDIERGKFSLFVSQGSACFKHVRLETQRHED
ncbi:glycoside hydrolase family 32 protein [Paenibacillus soyae]|uniref:beta-fructofuranosidase n=1 Tax=Paenibacillus soyae TaxID=2969249 RepID=A0A9X2S7P7_9BACL|nr:glycoside hydrolase family 32 protein [Paenibacillus soyae]MCR2803569.1 GH32 C-terminal domain-containing protein [Paenibacillus soyae]